MFNLDTYIPKLAPNRVQDISTFISLLIDQYELFNSENNFDWHPISRIISLILCSIQMVRIG